MFSNVKFRKIETNQYKLSQAADLICTVEAIAQKNVLIKSESEFFHSKNEFKKNIYKNIAKKKLQDFPLLFARKGKYKGKVKIIQMLMGGKTRKYWKVGEIHEKF